MSPHSPVFKCFDKSISIFCKTLHILLPRNSNPQLSTMLHLKHNAYSEIYLGKSKQYLEYS